MRKDRSVIPSAVEGGGVLGGNPHLQRIADGDSGGLFFSYEGEHRARGPKKHH